MATETSPMPVNGNYAPHQGFGGIEQQNAYAYATNNGLANPPDPTHPPPASTTPAAAAAGTTTAAAAASATQSEISKDEVGWYFVEQYYTTLSRNPDRLYLFYNKKSQFVSGQEADKVRVYGGQSAINDRIRELDFKECKVRVTNVDAQASESNIVIQVIGEMSNNKQPHKKFVQTFVLATQTNGYFVLNDIFRYLVDEEDELEAEPQAPLEEVQQVPAAESGFLESAEPVAEVEQKTLTSSNDPVAVEHDARQVDREIEDKVLNEPEPEATLLPEVNGVAAEVEPEVEHADDAPAAAVTAPTTADAVAAAPTALAVPETEKLASNEAEQPLEPAPTPSPPPPKAVTPQPAPAAKPAAPKTWASMAASANRVATPVTPATVATGTATQTRPTPPSTKPSTTPPAPATAAPPAAAPTAPAAQREDPSGDASQGDEWTAVGGSHARQQSRQTNYQQQQQDGPPTRAYIRNVHEGIGTDELKTHLEQFGELAYFDLSRPKSSAFVEFRTPDGYAAAVNANPHNVGGERLIVEERRPFGQRGPFQNQQARRGMNQGQQRGNYQNRGGYQPRGGRGGNATTAPRGRGGGAQAT